MCVVSRFKAMRGWSSRKMNAEQSRIWHTPSATPIATAVGVGGGRGSEEVVCGGVYAVAWGESKHRMSDAVFNRCVALMSAYRSYLRGCPGPVRSGPAVAHRCDGECVWWQAPSGGDVWVCKSSGNLHECTPAACDRLIHTREHHVCELTGVIYPLALSVTFEGEEEEVFAGARESSNTTPVIATTTTIRDGEEEVVVEVGTVPVASSSLSPPSSASRRRPRHAFEPEATTPSTPSSYIHVPSPKKRQRRVRATKKKRAVAIAGGGAGEIDVCKLRAEALNAVVKMTKKKQDSSGDADTEAALVRSMQRTHAELCVRVWQRIEPSLAEEKRRLSYTYECHCRALTSLVLRGGVRRSGTGSELLPAATPLLLRWLDPRQACAHKTLNRPIRTLQSCLQRCVTTVC